MNEVKTKQAALAITTALLITLNSPVWSQASGHEGHADMSPMEHESVEMEEMSMEGMTMDESTGRDAHTAPAHSGHGRMQGGSAPPDARDPHAYSDGFDFGPIPRPRLADEHSFGSLMVDRLEVVRNDDNTWSAYDLQAWYGRDYDRVVLKAEGEVDNGTLEEASTELLWGHAIAPFWDAQLGLRHDSGEGPNRSWLAVGVQGLAPYWFELDATGYLGESGRTAIGFEAEYELLLTQKAILQPRLEANLYGKDDDERALGSGLADVSVGLRLRYEIRREIAPYLGIEWTGLFGDTKDKASAAGQATSDTVFVAGLRFWF